MTEPTAPRPTRPTPWRRLAAALALGAAGALVGWGAARLGVQGARAEGAAATPAWLKLAHLVAAFVVIWLALLVHEAGHALAGASQGFRFLFLAAGPLWLERRGGRLSARLNTTASTWGGMAAAVPEDGRDLVRRFSVQVAGGPLASLLLAAFAAVAWSLLPPGLLRFTAGVAALGSAGLFLATAQPFGAGGGFASDGGRLLRLRRGGPEGAREAALLALTAASVGGARPRDWPAALLEDALAPGGGGLMEVAALVYAGVAAADRGDLDLTWARLAGAEALAEGQGDLVRSLVAGEAAWLAAVRGDAAGGRARLALVRGPFVERYLALRAEAAVRLAEGDVAGARAAAEAGLAALPRARFGVPSAREWELLEGIVEAAGRAVGSMG